METLRRRSLTLLQKDIGAKTLWALALGFILIKLVLTSFQMMLAAPDLAPIDDALLFNMAKSITAGNWLGDYNWLTLGKHSFYAFWLAALHALGIGPLLAGQLLYAAACVVFLASIKPLLQNHLLRLFVFAVVLYLPVSWAEYTLRIYRDNIHPALVFLLLSALLGAFVRPAGKWHALLFYYVVAGLSAAAIWLNHEDNLLLLPFLICAVLVYIVHLWCEKQQPAKKWRTLLWLLVPLLLWQGGLTWWKQQNLKFYGRAIVSDYTSKEFNDAMGALSRALPDNQKRYILLPYATRQALYEVSPTFRQIAPTLEVKDIYNGYGSVPDKEIFSGGLHWALRRAAQHAGVYKDAATAQAFWQAVANEVNAACEAGKLPAGAKRSGIFAPFKPTYLVPSIGKFFDQMKILTLYEQTSPYTILSVSTPAQKEEWESYLHTKSTYAAIAHTDKPYYSPLQRMAHTVLDAITWVMRLLKWPMLALCGLWLWRYIPAAFRRCKKGSPPADLFGNILLFGFFLTGILRIASLAYLFAVSIPLKPYLMYMAPASPLLLAFIAYGAAKWAQSRLLPNQHSLSIPLSK